MAEIPVTRSYRFGDVHLTVVHPEGLVPDIDMWFHNVRGNPHEAVIAAMGGVATFDVIDPTRDVICVECREQDGGTCGVYVTLGKPKPDPIIHQTAQALRDEQLALEAEANCAHDHEPGDEPQPDA